MPVISANTPARLEGYFRIEWKLAAQHTHAMTEAKPRAPSWTRAGVAVATIGVIAFFATRKPVRPATSAKPV